MEFYYKTTNGNQYELFPQTTINLSNMKIFEAKIPECSVLIINNNKLKRLYLPNGCISVNCSNNKLKKLDLPESITNIDCSHNKLTTLITPTDCINIQCNNNNLSNIIIMAKSVSLLNLSYNKLTNINISDINIDFLYLNGNLLSSLVLPKNILKNILNTYTPLYYMARLKLHNNKFPSSIKTLFESIDKIKITLASNLCKSYLKIY